MAGAVRDGPVGGYQGRPAPEQRLRYSAAVIGWACRWHCIQLLRSVGDVHGLRIEAVDFWGDKTEPPGTDRCPSSDPDQRQGEQPRT